MGEEVSRVILLYHSKRQELESLPFSVDSVKIFVRSLSACTIHDNDIRIPELCSE